MLLDNACLAGPTYYEEVVLEEPRKAVRHSRFYSCCSCCLTGPTYYEEVVLEALQVELDVAMTNRALRVPFF